MYDKMIKDILTKKIKNLKKEQENIQKDYQKQYDKQQDIINTLLDIKADILKLKDLDIKNTFKNLDNLSLELLNFYQIVLKQGYSLQESDLEKLNSLFDTEINYNQEIQNNLNKEENLVIEKQIKDLEILIKKVETYNLDDKDMELLKNIIIEDNHLREGIEIMKYLALKTLQKLITNKDDEIEVINKTNITKEDLEKLFQKYGINYQDIKSTAKSELETYGNLENIEQIILTLKQYNLFSTEIFNNYQLAISRIFIYSKPEIVESIIKTYQKYNLNISEFLDDFFKRPAKFIPRKRKWLMRNTDDKKTTNNKDDENIGGYEDFKKNLELFSSIGVDIEKAYQKSAFYFEKPHDSIKKSLKNFDLYGITPKYYRDTLSAFANHNQLDILDIFIEFNAFDYVTSNMSRACINKNSLMFYKMFKARENGIDIHSLYKDTKKGIQLPSTITYDDKTYLDVNKDNYQELNVYHKEPSELEQIFDEIVKKSDNNTIAFDFINQLNSIKILDKDYSSRQVRAYNIDGVLISRYKVLRYMTTLIYNGMNESKEMLMYTITKNSFLTKEEYEKIETVVENIFQNIKRM